MVLNLGLLRFYPNMYVILVGPSGCRKGTALGPALELLQELGVKLASEAITREALIRELNTSATTIIDVNGSPSFHSSLTIFSNELTVFLGYQNKQLMSDLCDWYDCRDRWTYRTKGSGTDEIMGVWVNLIGGTTPELIRSSLPLEAIGGGLTSRIIMIFEEGDDKRIVIPYGDPILRKKLLYDMELMSLLTGEYKYNESFLTKYGSWYLDPASQPGLFDDPYFKGYCSRRANHILKLSMICNASRDGHMVLDGQDFDRALDLLLHAEVKMPYVFRGVGKNVLADVTERLLGLLAVNKKMDLEEVMKRFYKDVDRQALSKMITTLKAMGTIDDVYEGNKCYLVFKH